MIAKLLGTEAVVFLAAVFMAIGFASELPDWADEALGWVVFVDFVAFAATLIWEIWS